ncbi:uncharacterized protein LOC119475692 isoform X2 [Xyrichtys novacula]|uniref:Uncharacterized protein LOC119475692 isoform X2 n=1 Tax=Xyrichtys novacula TaxID=13765 RepID=A0AAV1FTX1_XYRNO|nr:uncharacterized protein LOC119475692 isoform X2 [Xyrichtys novacula]
MALWYQALLLLCCTLNLVESSAPPPVLQQQNIYSNSFHLTVTVRTAVQQLQKRYKEEQWWNKHFEDRNRQLKGLPLLSTDFHSWLNLTDWDRLHASFRDLRTYWSMLEGKRKQLEKEEKERLVGRMTHNTLPKRIGYIQLDLRDLMLHVSSQMSNISSSWRNSTSSSHVDPETNFSTEWDSRVEGYIILRDLDLYLTKLARNFLLLASKTH